MLTPITGSNVLLNHSSSVFKIIWRFWFIIQIRRRKVSSTHYFCRVGNSEFNSTQTQLYVSSSGDIKIESFKNDPKTYITILPIW